MGSIEEVIVELRHVVAAKSGVNWRLNDFQNNRQGAICIRCTFSLRTIEDLHRIRLCKNRVHVDFARTNPFWCEKAEHGSNQKKDMPEHKIPGINDRCRGRCDLRNMRIYNINGDDLTSVKGLTTFLQARKNDTICLTDMQEHWLIIVKSAERVTKIWNF